MIRAKIRFGADPSTEGTAAAMPVFLTLHTAKAVIGKRESERHEGDEQKYRAGGQQQESPTHASLG